MENEVVQASPGTAVAEVTEPAAAAKAVWVYLSKLDAGTSRPTMAGCLETLAGLWQPGLTAAGLPWHELRYEHTMVLRARVAASRTADGSLWSPSHANKHLCALRGVLKQCWKLGLMSGEDYQRAASVPEVKGERMPRGRSIHVDEVAKLLATCLSAGRVIGIRDAALVAALQSTGVRCAEAAGARIEDYDASSRRLRVIGKGDKQRPVFIHRAAAMYLEAWLAIVGARRGALFRPVDRWGVIHPRHLAPGSIWRIINLRHQEAGLRKLSTHDFRHSFIGAFLDGGGDLSQAQRAAGHKSPVTTAQYDPRPAREIQRVVDKMAFPEALNTAEPARRAL